MRLTAGALTALLVLGACGGATSVASPTPAPPTPTTAAPTPSPTPSPSPTVAANVFKANLQAVNVVPPITDAEASCTGAVTLTITGTSAKFDIVLAGCPATTAPTLVLLHEGAAGINGPSKGDSSVKAGEVTLLNGGATISRTVTIDAAVATAIAANPAGFYILMHTVAHPPGAIRGQLAKG